MNASSLLWIQEVDRLSILVIALVLSDGTSDGKPTDGEGD
jgi:hypothetical protein